MMVMMMMMRVTSECVRRSASVLVVQVEFSRGAKPTVLESLADAPMEFLSDHRQRLHLICALVASVRGSEENCRIMARHLSARMLLDLVAAVTPSEPGPGCASTTAWLTQAVCDARPALVALLHTLEP
jgi:hypothetical protein